MVFLRFIQFLIEHSVSKPSGDPDQTLRSVATGLGLLCLHMDAILDLWVNHVV